MAAEETARVSPWQARWPRRKQWFHAGAGALVTFRTLDLGGDELPLAVRIAVGPNPALGMRGIRFSLDRQDIFRTQLRALDRAAAVGPLRIMLPLVSRVVELREARRICARVCEELARERVDHDLAHRFDQRRTGFMSLTSSAFVQRN